MIGAGYVRHVGLSEAGAETVHALRAIADAKGVTAAQIAAGTPNCCEVSEVPSTARVRH